VKGEQTAQAALAEKQRRFPPPGGPNGDRVAKLVASLRPSLPPELAALLDSDTLAVGELGEVHPDVATWPIGENRYVITFSTGMFVYLETVVRALSARFVFGASGPMAMEFEQVAGLLRDAMKTYRRQTSLVWSLFHPQFRDEDVQLSPELATIRATLIDLTARFLLAHEFGHVAIGAKVRPRSSDSEETDADRIGLEFSLRAAFATQEQGLAVAAAALAIRLYVSLQRFGARFTGAYPPMETRLSTLNDALLPILGSVQRRDELSRVMVATLDYADALDKAIDPSKASLPMSTDHLRIEMIALLYELSRGGLSDTLFDQNLQALAKDVPLDEFGTALTQVCEYYWQWADTVGMYFRDLEERSLYSHEWIIENSRALRAAVVRLPDAQRSLLPEQYRATTP
jgi:hypothetical protein